MTACALLLDYVQWLLALLEASPPSPKANLLLLDVGTGASAIYALLLARSSPKAHIFATDVDAFSLKIARRNIEQNALQDRITLIDTSLSVDILPHLDVEIDASMCNPPYYASRAEIEELASIKADLPTGICTGADSDMITTGGELGFVTRMIDESAARPNAIRWCTTQLGRLSSLEPLLKRLAHHHIDNYALCESTQSRTKRWLLAWSLQGDRLPDTIARSANLASKHLLPLPNTVGRVCRAGLKLPTVRDALLEHLLALSLQVESSDNAILVAASQPSWTRAARRAAERNEAQPSDVVIMRVLLELAQRGDDVVVSSTWQYGLDRQLFQSFCSHVWRQIDVS
ncbi:uncharacterized protein L969DRAFT_92005 [Mixia osmundae IAM 14324]|uniref:Methyltransferase small domain-containing protein n=1 Tax=Mixia osmundae (strain CBS 9802 / IAM 14324 / JCM 22182 / KY 12970) TaxID=764103 RepID=G7E2W5_MIXOS|nr:uncharacterized protein L969DRAFT_92005 [Mixia osmundae IAM 14324]KEI42567.1 hypothetical protein L969DRAFT_92005 [Mixia osmundae IAM 14324]GAA97146.1 hypothetical protein E5Q_03821 [Mixia osmundae IAM 14324]